jgi:hypothetical protein
LLSTANSVVIFYKRAALKMAPRKGDTMLTSFILALIKLLSNPVLVAALAKFLANALKTVS